MSLKLRIFGLREVPAVLERPAVAQILLDSVYYTIRTRVFYVVLFSPPLDNCLKLGPGHFFPPTFEFIVYYNPHSCIKIDQLDVTCFIISLFTAQHVSNVSTSIFRSLRLIVGLFRVLYCPGSMCVAVTVWFGWGGVVSLCRLKHCFSLHNDPINLRFAYNPHIQRHIVKTTDVIKQATNKLPHAYPIHSFNSIVSV